MNENVDAARIVEVLNRHRVAYVIIGGYAAELHAVTDLPPTRDIDVCPAGDRANLGRLSGALTEMHALIRTDAVDVGLPYSNDPDSLARASMWNLVCDAGELDITFELQAAVPRTRRRHRWHSGQPPGRAPTCAHL